MTYAEKLKDPRWQKKRLEILERDKYICQSCGAGGYDDPKSRRFHVHHIGYEPGVEPWDHPNELMETSCSDCHKEEHDALQDSVERLFRTIRRCGYKAEHIDRLNKIFYKNAPNVAELPERLSSILKRIIKVVD